MLTFHHLLHRADEGLDGGSGPGGVEEAKGNGVLPVHGQNLQQRVDPLLLGHRQQQGVFVFAPVEDLQVVKD